MNKILPDKWVRTAVFNLINNMTVNVIDINGNYNPVTIPCFESYQSVSKEKVYVVLSTQTADTRDDNKTEKQWESSLLIDIIQKIPRAGSVGSRVLVDDVADNIRNLTQNLTLDSNSGLTIIKQTIDFPAIDPSITVNETVFRKLIRYEFLIN